jgi:hypothetical protein
VVDQRWDQKNRERFSRLRARSWPVEKSKNSAVFAFSAFHMLHRR